MKQVFLALGSNVGDKNTHILEAVHLLREKISQVKVAPFYESKAVGFTGQDNFINTALSGCTDLSPEELLDFVKKIEREAGRIERFRWGPREIDIDILFYDDLILKTDTLEIPHPRLHERDFVLKPLSDIAPDFVHPVQKKTVTELISMLPEKSFSILNN